MQVHKHSSSCKRGKRCRFHFPKLPNDVTCIAKPCYDKKQYIYFQDLLKKVFDYLKVNTKTQSLPNNLSSLLSNLSTDIRDYQNALGGTRDGTSIKLKCNPLDCDINNYNPALLKAWQANMDVQYIINAYACIMYVASYITKAEKSMGELLKQVCKEIRTECAIEKSWSSIFNT